MEEKSRMQTACFDRDKEEEREIGELDGDLGKTQANVKETFKTEPPAAIWFEE